MGNQQAYRAVNEQVAGRGRRRSRAAVRIGGGRGLRYASAADAVRSKN